MTMANTQKNDFYDRLVRIHKGGPNTVKTIHIGPPDEDVVLGRKKMPGERVSFSGILLFPFAVVWAVVFGMAAVFAARYVRLELDGSALYGVGASNTLLLVDLSLAVFIAFLLKQSLRVRGRIQTAVLFVGIAVGLMGMHNMAHYLPDEMGAVYSQAWVSEAKAAGPAGSLVYQGEIVYALN